MPLLLAYRRWWLALFAAILALPTLGLVLPDLPGPVRPVTKVEATWWVRATERLDPFINAHFGFRGAVMAANASYARATHSTRARPVLIGDGGQLYFTGDQTLEQSLGLLVRAKPIADFIDVLTRLKARLEAKGITLVVAVPPNGATMLPGRLPGWARPQMRHPTELDIVSERLPQNGITFVDLRPILEAAKAGGGQIYRRTDTHWTQLGAVLAFNAVMAAAGRPELAIPLEEANGPLVPTATGDLSRILGESKATGDSDYEERLKVPPGLTPLKGLVPERPDSDPFQPYAYSTGHSGPAILVIGDSFTQNFWPRLLAARTSRFGWMHHSSCKFEADAIDRFKPDIVVYMPTERSLPCKGQPSGM